ncbi:MAG: DUF2974 domain-containing protein [Treponemataceae bacterium]|nr:DUF2974 domain-containing protein [Treponemataceae bacterium]
MSNLNDYIKWRGDLLFSTETLSPVDMLIFSQLVYTPLENVDPSCYGKTLGEIFPLVYPDGVAAGTTFINGELFNLWKQAAECRRFREIKLIDFVSKFDVDEQMQFAAAVFDYGNIMVIAFRGTDTSVIGWKEDFNMGYATPIPSQSEAVSYINSVYSRKKEIYVCGHSKGGNLAMYGGVFCKHPKYIKAIYSFDGPGFNDEVLVSKEWMQSVGKIESYIPESSIVGMILGCCSDYTIVKSDDIGIMQHNPFNWHIEGGRFEEVSETSFVSRLFRGTMQGFLSSCPKEQRRVLVETAFKIIEVSGAKNADDIPAAVFMHLTEIRHILQEVPDEDKQALKEMGRIFSEAGSTSLKHLLSKLWKDD